MEHKKKDEIDRIETFKLIKAKDANMDFETIEKKSDCYWLEICENLDITPIYQKVAVEA